MNPRSREPQRADDRPLVGRALRPPSLPAGLSPWPAPADWFGLMRHGDFAAAWQLSDQALRSRRGTPCWHLPRHLQYIWDGTPLHGKRVLVRCYHGLGDTIQFIRYAAPLKAIAREVIVWAQPSLLDLLATVPGIDRLLPLHDGAPDVAYDVDVELMELPHIFRTTLETIPRGIPYLRAPPLDGHFVDGGGVPSPRNPLRLKIGIVWRSGDWDSRRSIPAHFLWPLSDLPGVDLYILQHGTARKEWGATGVIVGDHTISVSANLLRAMDLVITVDTLTAHLAGALAVPVWTLLPYEADWRWMTARDDSPWYPTMRLFRQPRPGDWHSVANRVVIELRRSGFTPDRLGCCQ